MITFFDFFLWIRYDHIIPIVKLTFLNHFHFQHIQNIVHGLKIALKKSFYFKVIEFLFGFYNALTFWWNMKRNIQKGNFFYHKCETSNFRSILAHIFCLEIIKRFRLKLKSFKSFDYQKKAIDRKAPDHRLNSLSIFHDLKMKYDGLSNEFDKKKFEFFILLWFVFLAMWIWHNTNLCQRKNVNNNKWKFRFVWGWIGRKKLILNCASFIIKGLK